MPSQNEHIATTRHQRDGKALEQRTRRALRLAHALDTAFRIPGTRIRFGIDPLLGLLPGLGDAIAAVLGSYIIWSALRAGAAPVLIARMLGNIAIDAIVGAIPIAGTLFDVAFKAHRRNAHLLAEWSRSPAATEARQRRRLRALLVIAFSMVLVVSATLALGIWALIRLLAAL
jgi:hypothetical protein